MTLNVINKQLSKRNKSYPKVIYLFTSKTGLWPRHPRRQWEGSSTTTF